MTISPARANAIDSITEAIAHLGDALGELEHLPAHDPSTVALAAHAMNSYVSVTEATLGLLDETLRDFPDREVATWLAGLRHLGGLMQHALGRLLHSSAPAEFPLKPEYIQLSRLMERACDYYRPRATERQLEIVCRSVGDVPMAWADRVAVAVVADNLLSNAVRHSNAGGQVVVQILPGPGGVVCSVRDEGRGLTPLEQARLFQPAMWSAGMGGDEAARYGLTIAKAFVDRMGGRMWSESEPGKGACLSFRLPYRPAEPPA
jgi:NtrC-family two-component system sensor histidine kinase KinB